MIIANIATYPARKRSMLRVIERIAPQVEQLNLVLNEYESVPTELDPLSNVRIHVLTEDLKDVGKFFPTFNANDLILLLDDDIEYPENYVNETINKYLEFGVAKIVAGYHASIYLPLNHPRLRDIGVTEQEYRSRLSTFRQIIDFTEGLGGMHLVDQLGTGTIVTRGDLMPPLSYMRGSEGYCDVRFSKWCYENSIKKIALPRQKGYLGQQSVSESLLQTVTRQRYPNIEAEIHAYASKERNIGAKVSFLNRGKERGPSELIAGCTGEAKQGSLDKTPPFVRPRVVSGDLGLFWSRYEPRNFGDWLGPYLYEKLTGKAPIFVPQHCFEKRDCIFSVGSIMRKITVPDRAVVWGSGVISIQDRISKPKVVLAVRGPRTAGVLKKHGYLSTRVFGDPAILLPMVFKANTSIRYKLGLIPHFIDYKEFQGANDKLLLNLGVDHVIDVTKPIESVINEINSCEFILSSSLHGLIVAHCYGKKAVWIRSINRLDGDGIKFLDYFESFNLPSYRPIDLFNLNSLPNNLFSKNPLPHLEEAQQDLLNLCPY